MADARSSTVLGATIGKHRIVRLIGGGSVGRVFVCRLNDLASEDDTQVAIKVLRTKHAAIAEKLMRDRGLVEKIASPHVVQVHDVAVYNNVPYVVMELVEGESLAVVLQRGPLKSADALELARAVCLGLQAAWAQGVAHGDVRPQNVLLPNSDVQKAKLTDFMLAPPIEGTESVRGSPAYVAPEILVGTPADALTDLYAVGCMLYECLVGRTPFTGGPASILHAQVNTPPPSLAAAVPGPQAVVDLVERLLDKDRSKRMKTHAEALEGIERALKGLSLPAPAKPQVPELDVDMDIFGEGAGLDDGFEDSERTEEIHTSAAREHLEPSSDEKPRVVVAAAKKPAPKPKPAAMSLAELEVEPASFDGVDDDSVDMTRVADPATLMAASKTARPLPKPAAVSLADLEVDPNAAEAFEGVHDEGFEMTRVADAATLLASAKPAPKRAPPKVSLADLEVDPNAAEAFDGVHDEGFEMTRVADAATLLAATAPAPKRPASAIRGAPSSSKRGLPTVSLADLEVDPNAEDAFAGVHDEGVEMTRVAVARPAQPSHPPRGAKPTAPLGGRRAPPVAMSLEELEVDPNAEQAFEGVHDEGVEMTRVADAMFLTPTKPVAIKPVAATKPVAAKPIPVAPMSSPPKPLPVASMSPPAMPPRAPAMPPPLAMSLADLEVDPNAEQEFEGVHDEGVEMTRVADAMFLAPVVAPSDLLSEVMDEPKPAAPPVKKSAADIRGTPFAASASSGPRPRSSSPPPSSSPPARGRPLPSVLPVAPVVPAARPKPGPARAPHPEMEEEPEEMTRVQGGITANVPSAEDLGLVLEEVPKAPKPRR